MSAAATVEEARSLAQRLVEYERGKCAGDVDVAIHRASSLYGVDESALRSLRYRWRTLRYVKAHILDRLRHANEWLAEQANQERESLQRTAQILEQRRSPAARLARIAAEMAGTEK